MNEQLIGNYKILEKLSESETSAVYRAVDTLLPREVVIKVLRHDFSSQTELLERFHLEAANLGKLSHPNIPTLYSFFAKEGKLFIIMEFLQGKTLDKVLREKGAFSCRETIPMFIQALDCLEYAHSLGIVHGDIKPANIMLTDAGSLKVLGFSIAEHLGIKETIQNGNIADTLEYISPGQRAATDARIDIFKLGITLYQALTGEDLFCDENKSELKELASGDILQSLREINAEIPEVLGAVIMKALARNPDERFQTAAEFRQALTEIGFNTVGADGDAKVGSAEESQLHLLQTFELQDSTLKDSFQVSTVTSPDMQSERVSKQKPLRESSINFFSVFKKRKNRKSNPAQIQAKRPRRLGVGKMLAGAAIFTVIALHSASQFIFFQSEPPASRIEANNEQNFEIKTEPVRHVESKTEPEVKTDAVKTDAVKVAEALPKSAPPELKAAPARAVIKKKEPPRESKAERLRRAERILTGV